MLGHDYRIVTIVPGLSMGFMYGSDIRYLLCNTEGFRRYFPVLHR